MMNNNIMRRTVAWILTLVMFMSCVPTGVLADIIHVSNAVQPFSLLPVDETPYITYTFTGDGVDPVTQIVGNGEELYAPKSPEKEGYQFLGWYTDANVKFDSFGIQSVTESDEITLTAKFQKIYYVFFLDTTGRVIKTKNTVDHVENGAISCNDVIFDVGAEESIVGWYTDSGLTNKVDTVMPTDSNITLYPKIGTGNWITYDAQGYIVNDAGTIINKEGVNVKPAATYVVPAFVAANGASKEPDEPTRVGYTFKGWVTESGAAFTFGEALTAPVTLYATWLGAKTQYTVVHWQENANWKNPYLAAELRDATQWGLADTETIEDVYAGSETDAEANSYTGFDAQPIEQTTVNGDGSTIVNVYYTRKEYSVKFYSRYGVTLYACGKQEHEHDYDYRRWNNNRYNYYGGCYSDTVANQIVCTIEEHNHSSSCGTIATASDLEITSFRITAKYGATITSAWPKTSAQGSNWSTNSSGDSPWQANIAVMPLNGDEFWVPDISGSNKYSATYYVEVLPGETGTTTVDNIKYKVHHIDEIKGNGFTVSAEDQYDIDGFTFNSAPSTDIGESYSNSEFYYKRDTYYINFFNNGTQVHTVPKLFEESIADVSYTPDRPASIPKEYTFQGWYQAENGAGDKFVFTGTMPSHNITLHAYWAPPTFKGTIHITMAGTGGTETVDIAYGSMLTEDDLSDIKDKVEIPDGYEWAGWCIKNEKGELVPFNHNQQLYDNVTLYPKYVSTSSFTVTYKLGEGSGTAPVDSKNYAQDAYADVMAATGVTAPTGKVFLYWVSSVDGKTYYPQDKLQMPDKNVTLTAVYGPVAATTQVTYNDNFSGKIYTPKQLLNNEKITVLSYDATGLPVRSGYKFIGWSTKSGDNNTVDFAAGTEARVNTQNAENNVLYAVWQEDTFDVTVRYYWVGTTTKMDEKALGKIQYGTEVNSNEHVKSIDGYTFAYADPVTLTVTNDASKNIINIYYYKNVTVTANDVNVPYDGEKHGVNDTPGAVLSGQADGHKLGDYKLSGEAGPDAGTYPKVIVVSDAKIVDAGNNDVTNGYKISYVPGDVTITPVDKVTVTITENSGSEKYDGTEKTITGYTVSIDNELYTEADFTFSGNATVKGTDAGSYPMELKASDFTNNSKNFKNVEFVIVDGTLE
ncbi:MAG: InlB B-repeat-containing protein, partial [Clostridia bacterium]|nr:InlB B-repeat-containing protein [Clostridia bacterium]